MVSPQTTRNTTTHHSLFTTQYSCFVINDYPLRCNQYSHAATTAASRCHHRYVLLTTT